MDKLFFKLIDLADMDCSEAAKDNLVTGLTILQEGGEYVCEVLDSMDVTEVNKPCYNAVRNGRHYEFLFVDAVVYVDSNGDFWTDAEGQFVF